MTSKLYRKRALEEILAIVGVLIRAQSLARWLALSSLYSLVT
jgi:hypothetical protein